MKRLAGVCVFVAAWAAPSAAAAQVDCAMLADHKRTVCEAAVTAQAAADALRQARSSSCAAAALTRRLGDVLAELPRAAGLLPAEFETHRAARRIDGVEYEQTELFSGSRDRVVIALEEGASEEPDVCHAARDERAPLEEAVRPVARAIAAHNALLLKEGAANLRRLADTWTWLITDGFGQFPWERAFNDLVHRQPLSIFELPAIEWVVVHPSIGMALTNLDDLRASRGQPVLFVEPLGFVRYAFDVPNQKRRYWGVSMLVAISDDAPPAVGGLIRYNKYSVGAAKHLRDNGAGGHWALVATVELLERTQPARRKLVDAKARVAGRQDGNR